MGAALVALLLVALNVRPARAFDLPLQVDLSIPMPAGVSARRFAITIEPGNATIRGVVRNQRDGRAARIDLVLEYRISRGTIAFDEIIDGIELATEDTSGA